MGSVGRSGFPCPSQPCIVCVVAGCSSLLLSTWSSRFSQPPSGSGRQCLGRAGFHGGPSRSFLCQLGYPEYRFVSSLLKTFAVALVLTACSWRKHIAFLLNYLRVLSHRSLETFHLGFCGAGFWPWFSPWPFARTYLPFSDSCLKVDSFVFSPALHRCPLKSLVQRLVFTAYVSIFSSGRFWLTLLCYPIPLHGVTTVVTLGFASHLRS